MIGCYKIGIESHCSPLLFLLMTSICRFRMPRNYVKKKKFLKYSGEDLQKAVDAVESARMSRNQASKTYGIPRGTLRNKVAGRHKKSHGGQPVLSAEGQCFAHNIAANIADFLDLRLMVKSYLDKTGRVIELFKNNPPDMIGRRDLKRQNPILSTRMCQNISRKRAKVGTDDNETFGRYFVRNQTGAHCQL